MAIKQVVPILITLQGDGTSTTFTYALANLYQAGVGGSIPFGTAGVVPSSVVVNNPSLAITSSTVDANGNITITFTTAPGNGVQVTLEVDLVYNSGAASSSSATQSMNVNVTGGTITATDPFSGNTGSAVPAQAAYMGGKNAGNLVGIAVDASGNVGVNVVGSLPAGSATIGAVTQASGPWTSNITQVGGSSVTLGSKTSANSFPVVIASDQGAVAISGTVTANAGTGSFTVAQATAANLNATVVGTGTFAVQATQSGTWNVGTLTSITNAVTVAQPTAANLNATVVGTGTFAVQAAQTGTWTVAQGTAAASTAGWPVTAGQTAETTAAWTSATSSNTALALTVTGYGTVIVSLNQGSTISGGVVTFEVSDTSGGTNWYAIQGTQVNGFVTSNTYTLTQSVNSAFQFDVAGWVKFRVRLSTVITGTATVNVGIAAQSQVSMAAVTVGQPTAANLNATVVQATAASLNATVVGTGTFAVQAAQSGNWTSRTVGNAGGVFDAATGTAIPSNAVQIGASDGTNLWALSINAKGTQGALGLAIQELKDAGRTYITFSVDAATLVITTEALISVNPNKGGTLNGAATFYTVTSGKTLRLQSISASVQGTNSVVQYVKVRVRAAASVTASSPIVANLFISNAGVPESIGYAAQDFPDGIEIAAGQQIGISQIGSTANGTVTVTLIGYEY